MPDDPMLSLVVIRVSDINRSVKFFSDIGLTFKLERHGTGPDHYSTTFGETVFELYPESASGPITQARFGFTVPSIDSILNVLRGAGYPVLSEPKDSPWGIRAVIVDPDGNRIELIQSPTEKGVPKELLEIYSYDSNFAVIKPPGRHFPGAVIQGDSLAILCNTAKRIAIAVRDNQMNAEDFPYDVEELLHELLGRLQHYQRALELHGHEIPTSYLVQENDFIKLTPDGDN